MQNIILNTDSYKTSTYLQYPEGTTTVHSYIEARKGGKFDKITFFGLQAFLKEISGRVVTRADIDAAEIVLTAHGVPFNRKGWEYIVEEHGGRLPLRIMALEEGKTYSTGTVLVSIENTDPECFWLTTYIETAMLRAVWYPSTVCTISREIKEVLADALERTGDVSGLDFKLHDFGARGVSSEESAMLGGMAHLVNFMGTDTISGLLGAKMYYNADMPGFSIPAMEHSTVTSWGKENEAASFRNMLEQYGKEGSILACVSDSYDLSNAVHNIWGWELKKEVQNSGATVVVRPDSGDPVDNVYLAVSGLAAHYGFTFNDKGCKVLNNVRVIQGDGIEKETVVAILERLEKFGWSADNVAFGMGGALLQHCDRDWARWAMKCSAIEVNGEWRDVFKQPATDAAKASKKGRFVLPTVFLDGELLKEYSFEEVRENAKL